VCVCVVGVQLNHEQVAFQRRYINYIKRCDELERKLRYIKGEMDKFGLNTEVTPQ
jgi:V-type H+-transporting ATPase subunit a